MPATACHNAAPRLLNLGCGRRTHVAWHNVDFVGRNGVLAADLRRGVPFPDAVFDAVYNSHVLEHFERAQAPAFLAECRRVLRAGGILRVVVPDLENMARIYLQALDRALGGDSAWQQHYDWMMLELYDQTVRSRPGGEMAAYLRQPKVPNLDFVLGRLGGEARQILDAVRTPPRPGSSRLRSVFRLFTDRDRRRDLLARLILGRDYEAFQLGQFRQRGEIHLWMYDRYSLCRCLEEAGFSDVRQVAPAESRIPDWPTFNLDTEPDGRPYKPDSLYMEAVKP